MTKEKDLNKFIENQIEISPNIMLSGRKHNIN